MTSLIDLQPGAVFARDFKVERPLSEGGMGAVYVVEQISTGKRRALKVMHPRLVADARSRERFTQEARIGSQINSENVVEVVAAGVDENSGTPWLAMELLEGTDLAEALKQRGRFTASEVLEVMDQLCDALARAHEHGIIHRDLKPENIYLAAPRRRGVNFVVKILDFGIARMVQDNEAGATSTSAIGSPLWMAPEQATAGSKHRPATDVWALGLIAFKLLTGKAYWAAANVPSESFNLQALLVEVMVNPLALASARAFELGCPGVLPSGFDAWFARCVDRDPAQRFIHAAAVFTALAPMLRAADSPMAPTGYVATQVLAAAPSPVSLAPAHPLRTEAVPQSAITEDSMANPMVSPVARQPSRRTGMWAAVGGGTLLAVVGTAVIVHVAKGPSSTAPAAPAPSVVDASVAAAVPRGPTEPGGYHPPSLDIMSEDRLGDYAYMLHQAGNAPAARQAMTVYLQRFPAGRRVATFRSQLQARP